MWEALPIWKISRRRSDDKPHSHRAYQVGHQGVPSDVNAHPHVSQDGKIAIVHNGIIENYVDLKQELAEKHGIEFKTETDSEVIAQLIGVIYEEKKGSARIRI